MLPLVNGISLGIGLITDVDITPDFLANPPKGFWFVLLQLYVGEFIFCMITESGPDIISFYTFCILKPCFRGEFVMSSNALPAILKSYIGFLGEQSAIPFSLLGLCFFGGDGTF